MTTDSCEHVQRMDYLVLLSSRHTSVAGTAADILLANEAMAECRTECGDQSPYRNVEPLPEPLPLVHYSAWEEFWEPWVELGRGVRALARAGLTRLRGRTTAR